MIFAEAPRGHDAGTPVEVHRLRQVFCEFAREWKEETSLAPSVREMVLHPAYQQIIGMGTPAIPLILDELRRQPDHWFWALRMIARQDPVPDSARGDIEAMAEAWLGWGRDRGYVE
ncbi:MAG: hypothetical protein R6V05_15065 [Candidatus Brocadiia bacterium]